MRDRYVLLTRRKDLNDFDDQISCKYGLISFFTWFTRGYRKVKKNKKFKEVEVIFGKILPDQFPNWEQTGYEWVFDEIYGADFSTLTKEMEEDSF